MKNSIFLSLVCVLGVLLDSAQSERFFLTEHHEIRYDPVDSSPVWADFEDNLNRTGWLNLKIHTNSSYSDKTQMYAAGFLEGYLTQTYIRDAYHNFVDSVLGKNPNISTQAMKFITDQLAWIEWQISVNNGSAYWSFVEVLMAQLKGMHEGYLKKAQESGKKEDYLDFFHFYYLTNMGDLEDIIPAFEPAKMKDPLFKECTGFIKLEDLDLFTSHNTHNIYSLMLRIFKTYDFPIANPSVRNRVVSYSARPGDLESKDDFYVLGQRLVVIESSLNNYNTSMYSFIERRALPVWIRVNIANKFANSAEEWVSLFSQHNSGTHNNQWAVVDYGLYMNYRIEDVPSKEWNGVVWLLEQFFYLADKRDVTQEYLIQDGYFATYNFPYHNEIFELGNYSINNPHDSREDIIRDFQGQVHTIDDVKKLIILNNNATGNPCTGIAPRCDLNPSAFLFGAIDGKVTSGDLILNNSAWIYSSPSHDNLQPFSFANHEDYPHRGIPEVMNFNWTIVSLI